MNKKYKYLLSGVVIVIIILTLIFIWYSSPIIDPKNGTKVHGDVLFSTEFSEDNAFVDIHLKVDNQTIDWWSAIMNCPCPDMLKCDTNELSNGWHYFVVSRCYSRGNFQNSTFMLNVKNL